ncbi:ELWxxDGT repeat protein [Larkinella bovis]|uniref:ELWxxDGT repeat protein n=1 Tax=Larkinella bovis TaxID=683041 RepID=A0ABW0IEI7_9BACT
MKMLFRSLPRFLAAVCVLANTVFAQIMPAPTPSYYVSKVKELNPDGIGASGASLVELNGKLYFVADNGTSGKELWVSNGTEAGTYMLKNINLTGSSTPYYLTVMNGALYFSADNGTHGRELWKTDGTAGGTRMVREINPSGDADPMGLVANGNILYFSADNGTVGRELWKTDGTAEGTRMVKDINPAGSSMDAYLASQLVVYNGNVYFGAKTVAYGLELWVSDGTSAGTVLVKNCNPTGDGNPQYLTVCNGKLFFSANGSELWKSDGTSAGTVLVKTVNAMSLKAVGTTLFFAGLGPTTGRNLWKSDGTSAGTVLVRNINLSGDDDLNSLTAFQNQLFFAASDGTSYDFWKSDGTYSGTQKVKSISPHRLTVIGNSLYFSSGKLWKSDGTSDGTKALASGYAYSDPWFMTGLGNKILFFASDQSGDYELYQLAPCTICPIPNAREGTGPESVTGLTLTVSKNPTPDDVTVEIRGAAGQPLSLHLTNLLGQLIVSKMIETAGPLERHRFDLRTQPGGLLLFRAISGEHSQTVRISKTD